MTDDTAYTMLELGVRGKVGEQVRLGDVLSKIPYENREYINIRKDGNLIKSAEGVEDEGVLYTLVDDQSSISDYVYTIKENWHEETIDVKSKQLTSSENTGSGT